ncbi:hypothetical protein M885DRAFT_460906, partial [Pelagophyceae sp. CCMP2097]
MHKAAACRGTRCCACTSAPRPRGTPSRRQRSTVVCTLNVGKLRQRDTLFSSPRRRRPRRRCRARRCRAEPKAKPQNPNLNLNRRRRSARL